MNVYTVIIFKFQAMTELERRSSSDLLSRGEGKQGLRQRRDKEQMVSEHGAVTQSLQVIFILWQSGK